jgi:hypothetical protein
MARMRISSDLCGPNEKGNQFELRFVMLLKQSCHQMHRGVVVKVGREITQPNSPAIRPVAEDGRRTTAQWLNAGIDFGGASLKFGRTGNRQHLEWGADLFVLPNRQLDFINVSAQVGEVAKLQFCV